jgi:transcriptional regulator with XRE-family HTH domain
MTFENTARASSATQERDKRTASDVSADRALGAMLRRTLSETGTTEREIAEAIGVCPSSVSKLTDGVMSLRARHVATLPDRDFGVFLDKVAAGRGYAVIKLPDTEELAELQAIEWTEQNAAAFAAVFRAKLDGHIDRAEGAEIDEKCTPLVRTVLAAALLGRTAVREGVIGIPKRSSSTQTKAAR